MSEETPKSPFLPHQPRRGVFAEKGPSSGHPGRPAREPFMREVPDTHIALTGTMARRTERAVRFEPNRSPEEGYRCRKLWVPLSEIHETTLLGGDRARLVVPRWLYNKHRIPIK